MHKINKIKKIIHTVFIKKADNYNKQYNYYHYGENSILCNIEDNMYYYVNDEQTLLLFFSTFAYKCI